MKYYIEASHYTPLAGKMVVKRIYGTDSRQRLPEDFGVQLSSKNLSQHFSSDSESTIALGE